MGYRVFISFKNLDKQENPTPDSIMAEELYHALSAQGINAFYSNISLKDLAASDFLDAIYAALEQCSIFVAVGSDISHFESRWLKFEARTFQMEYLNGNKNETEYGMITYVTPNLRCSQAKFIQPLRDMQSFCALEDVVEYVTNRLENSAMLKRMSAEDNDDDIRYDSVSLADRVYERRYGVAPAVWDADKLLPKMPPIVIPLDDNNAFDDVDLNSEDELTTMNLPKNQFNEYFVGTVVMGHYQLIAHIASGGSSDVYLSQNLENGSINAAKMLRESLENDQSQYLFETEVKMLQTLKHPMVPGFVDADDKCSSPLIIMEYISGTSLQKLVERDGAQREALVIDWMQQLCGFLSYLHGQGLVYRDLKPSNIVLQRSGALAVLDYASVQKIRTTPGDTISLGTVGYAAPEQYGHNGTADERTDIYCLGAAMRHMATGEAPSLDMKSIRTLNPDISMKFEYIIEKCLHPNPAERYANIDMLRRDLNRLEQSYTGTDLKTKIKSRFSFIKL